jgi:hypothetical protein
MLGLTDFIHKPSAPFFVEKKLGQLKCGKKSFLAFFLQSGIHGSSQFRRI